MFAENLTEFLDTDDFAVNAVFNSTTVQVIFDNAYVAVEGFEGVHPVIQGKESDFTSAVQGSLIVINGITYVMREIQPDGTGWIVIRLHKQ